MLDAEQAKCTALLELIFKLPISVRSNAVMDIQQELGRTLMFWSVNAKSKPEGE